MSLSPYPTYQQTNLEWVESLPEHWPVKPLKRNVELLTEKTDSNECPVGLENIEGWTGRFIETESEFQGEGVGFEANDILFGKLRPYLAKAWLADREGEAVGDFHVLRPLSGNFPGFIKYQLLTREVIDLVNGSTYGAKMPRASWDFLGSLGMPTPSEKEQAAIANFLDRETAKIDALIAEQERLIELLQEKRQAVISHAVTKGLNPDALMKDSGVEWLGEVPEHWEETNIKRISKIYGRIGFRGYTVDDIVDEGDGAIALAPGNLKEKGFSLNKKTYISWEKYEESPEIMIKQGDVLLVKTGSTFGKCCYIDRLNEAATLNPQMVVFKEIIPENEFFYYQLRSTYVQAVIQNMNKGSALPTITQEAIGSIKLFIPPINEQQSILAQLSKTLIGNEELLDNSRKAISLLSERRSALISAGVTGQIDVRNLFPEEATP